MRTALNQLRPPRRNGTILIVTMLVCFALAGAVLALSRTMRVEMIASANSAASIQAGAVERGAEQYVLNLLQQNGGPGTIALTEDYFEAQQIGDGYFWVLRPAYDDDTMPMYGLVDEQSKLNINGATPDQLLLLPNITDDTAQAIYDWRVGSSRVDLQACKLEYSIVSPK